MPVKFTQKIVHYPSFVLDDPHFHTFPHRCGKLLKGRELDIFGVILNPRDIGLLGFNPCSDFILSESGICSTIIPRAMM